MNFRPKCQNGQKRRKSVGVQGEEFPSKMSKRAKKTEVCDSAGRKTSVLNAENGHRRRKSERCYESLNIVEFKNIFNDIFNVEIR